MAKMSGMANGAMSKRSSNDDKPLNTPSKGMMTRESEKVLTKMPPKRGGADMEDMRSLGNAKDYLKSMHTENSGPTFSQTKSIHNRMAGQAMIDKRED